MRSQHGRLGCFPGFNPTTSCVYFFADKHATQIRDNHTENLIALFYSRHIFGIICNGLHWTCRPSNSRVRVSMTVIFLKFIVQGVDFF